MLLSLLMTRVPPRFTRTAPLSPYTTLCRADFILFTVVHRNYLRQSIVSAGMDPENLPAGDLKTMNFGSGGNTNVKAWKDIWGSGQGIGPVTAVRPVAEFVAELEAQYLAADRKSVV